MGDQELRERLGANAAVAARRYSHDQIIAAWNLVIASAVERQFPSKPSDNAGL